MNNETYHSHTAFPFEVAVVEGTKEILGGIQRQQVLCKKDKVLRVTFQEGKIYSVGKTSWCPSICPN